MRPADPALIAMLASGRPFAFQDCYTFWLVTGDILRYTDGQQPIRFQPPEEPSPALYSAAEVVISGMKMRSARGLEVDEQDCSFSAKPSTTVQGMPLMVAFRYGVFDGGIVARDRVYMQDFGSPVLGSIRLFAGRVSTIDPGGDTTAIMKVKSELIVLDQPMPRNKFQNSCKNVWGDAGCTINKGDYAVTDTVDMGSTKQIIITNSATAGVYDQGTITMETGVNVGQSRTIRRSTGTSLILTFPFDLDPNTGDQFKIYPGCNLTMDDCVNKFSNLANFRGFPFVPPAETAL